MQPLSRVRSKAQVTWGASDTITSRPKVAIRIAECIAEWADIEATMGLFLGILLDTDSKAALAMYSSVENRSSQRKMIMAAAEAKLPLAHFDVITAVMTASVAPVMKERDKLAHWCWGYARELPEALLICEPAEKMERHFMAVHRPTSSIAYSEANPDEIFVVTEPYLKGLADRMREAKRSVSNCAATVWTTNTQQERDEHLRLLSNEPQIQKALIRLHEGRQKSPEAPQPSPPLEPSGKA